MRKNALKEKNPTAWRRYCRKWNVGNTFEEVTYLIK